jgi:hypothetical protein
MKRITITGLCLAAMTLTSAVATTTASAALPEFSGPFSKTFTSTSGKTLLETVGKAKLVCGADTNLGEITGPQTGVVKIKFTKCAVKSIPCNTPGLPAGEIATTILAIKLGYINKAKKEVGMDLLSATGAPVMEFMCGSALRGLVIGSVIGRVTPINKPVVPPKTFLLKFTQALGVQKPVKLEGQPKDVLETSFGGPFEESGLASTDSLLFGEPVVLAA